MKRILSAILIAVFCAMLLPSGGVSATTDAPVLTPPSIRVGDIVPFGFDTLGWRIWNWQVLDVQDNRALLISDSLGGIMLNRPFCVTSATAGTAVTWETSDIRSWLNDVFYQDIFSDEERESIFETQVFTNNNPWFGTPGGNTTTDKIFLLSIEETVYYFGDSGQLQNRPTLTTTAIDDKFNVDRSWWATVSSWWLRSPGNQPIPMGGARVASLMAMVGHDGHIDLSGVINQVSGYAGVRPAMWVDINALAVVPPTNGDCDCIDFSHPDLIVSAAYASMTDIAVHASTDNFYINLSRETITFPDNFTPATFRVAPNRTFTNVRADGTTFTTRFPTLLNRPMSLQVVGRFHGADEDATITFPSINGRAPVPRVRVNYSLLADWMGLTNGQWVLTTRPPSGQVPEVVRDGIEIGVAAMVQPNPNRAPRPANFVDDNGFGRFFDERGICVMSLPEAIPPARQRTFVTRRYILRAAPSMAVNDDDGTVTYTAASGQRSFNIRSQQLLRVGSGVNLTAVEERLNNDGTIRTPARAFVTVSRGRKSSINGNLPILQQARAEIDVLGFTGNVRVWIPATQNRPASQVRTFQFPALSEPSGN